MTEQETLTQALLTKAGNIMKIEGLRTQYEACVFQGDYVGAEQLRENMHTALDIMLDAASLYQRIVQDRVRRAGEEG